MTKEEARQILTEYLNDTYSFMDETVNLPITDVNINTISYDIGFSHVIETRSFRGLLKIAYNLKDND